VQREPSADGDALLHRLGIGGSWPLMPSSTNCASVTCRVWATQNLFHSHLAATRSSLTYAGWIALGLHGNWE